MLTATINDIRYALRGFRRAPLVAFTVVSTVALGLGLVAVAFTLLNTVLFRSRSGRTQRRQLAGRGGRDRRRRRLLHLSRPIG